MADERLRIQVAKVLGIPPDGVEIIDDSEYFVSSLPPAELGPDATPEDLTDFLSRSIVPIDELDDDEACGSEV